MNAAQLINQTSGEVEFYTPPEIVDAARRVLGRFDLDPASSPAANKRIGARHFFTYADDGLAQDWSGRAWMNHPFGIAERKCGPKCTKKICERRGYHCTKDYPGNAGWINKLEASHLSGAVPEACCITFSSTSEAWFQPLLRRPQCFLAPRTNYLKPDGSVFKGITKGSVVTYYGGNVAKFAREFKHLGAIHVPFQQT